MAGFLILLGVVAGIIYFIKHLPKIKLPSMRLPYTKRDALFSPAEKLFLDALEKAVGDQYKIYGKVRMADIMDVKTNLSASDNQIAFNGISSKHLDFVLCDLIDASFICGIELDDKSHNQANRVKRDRFVNEAFAVISLPLIRFEAKAGYDVDKIRNQILSVLGALTPDEPSSPSEEVQEQKEGVCPRCSGQMTRKKASTGASAGKTFWVCDNYQTCKTALPADS